MDILTNLIVYQGASVSVCVDKSVFPIGVKGILTITVAGTEHTLTVQRMTVGDVLQALEIEYLHHDWTMVPIVEVHSGVAEVVSGNAIIVDFDNLKSGKCPKCGSDLEFPWDIDARECSCCHYIWAKEDEQ